VTARDGDEVEVRHPDFGPPRRYRGAVRTVLDFFAEARTPDAFGAAFAAPPGTLDTLLDDLLLATPAELEAVETLRRVQPRLPPPDAPRPRRAPGLADLVGRGEAFRRDHWPHRFAHTRASPRLLRLLDATPELGDVEALARAWGAPFEAWRPGQGFTAAPWLMTVLYRRGWTLYLLEVERWLPALRGLADGLARDLGVGRERITFQAFASRAGAGSPPHCDFDLNFNVQLRGRKTWRVAENRHLEHPREAHALGAAPSEEIRAYARAPLPVRMPRDAHRFETTRGSVVFLPRGVWHGTRASQASFSLNCVVVPPTWLELLQGELDRRLRTDAGLREYAIGLGDEGRAEAHRARLRDALSRLADAAAALDPDELLARWAATGDPPPRRGR
jgi:50S ribosomal protein L16 3-hydroxylase